jgi:2-polyprenyl-3-methyl-5-hydroxy-6-metoxy-1,4-benzoquinol methylase
MYLVRSFFRQIEASKGLVTAKHAQRAEGFSIDKGKDANSYSDCAVSNMAGQPECALSLSQKNGFAGSYLFKGVPVMARTWNSKKFKAAYEDLICQSPFAVHFGSPDYYSRYRLRYQRFLRSFCELAPPTAVDVLDIGGGQLALLCKHLWADRACVADIAICGPLFDYLQSQSVEAVQWDLCKAEQPFIGQFDFIFFSEVIEHLPLPGHVVLERLRRALKPGGTLICSTPNFYRLRNVVYLALGLPIFDYFRMPEESGLSHVIEYTRDHLQWQLEKAGFKDCHVSLCQMHRSSTNPLFRIMSWIGYPLLVVPRFRAALFAVARAP